MEQYSRLLEQVGIVGAEIFQSDVPHVAYQPSRNVLLVPQGAPAAEVQADIQALCAMLSGTGA